VAVQQRGLDLSAAAKQEAAIGARPGCCSLARFLLLVALATGQHLADFNVVLTTSLKLQAPRLLLGIGYRSAAPSHSLVTNVVFRKVAVAT
jgi:hypothetical protein